MMNSKHTLISQAAIGRALGLSPASMTKCKAMGMPVDSVENAHAWRQANINPTAHRFKLKRETRADAPQAPSGAVLHMQALMSIAAFSLGAGQSIAAMVPALREALRAVPEPERGADFLLPLSVMDVLVSEVAEAIDGGDCAHVCTEPAANMSDDDIAYMAQFWYRVAAGEVRSLITCPT